MSVFIYSVFIFLRKKMCLDSFATFHPLLILTILWHIFGEDFRRLLITVSKLPYVFYTIYKTVPSDTMVCIFHWWYEIHSRISPSSTRTRMLGRSTRGLNSTLLLVNWVGCVCTKTVLGRSTLGLNSTLLLVNWVGCFCTKTVLGKF